MKVIELLNRISEDNGVPYIIKINNDEYRYNYGSKMYYRADEDKEAFYTDAMITGFVSLEDEVEVIEDVSIRKKVIDEIYTEIVKYGVTLTGDDKLIISKVLTILKNYYFK